MTTELLIDWLYRQTFKKGSRDPALRRDLMACRRCILSADMAAFMYTLMIEVYGGNDPGGPHWLRRCHRRLDDCRHFSRLPHPLTWVEYPLAPMLQREIVFTNPDFDVALAGQQHAELAQVKRANSRVGWLFRQHPTIETAVQADYFYGASNGPRSAAKPSPQSFVWCTDDAPLPWSDVFYGIDGETTSAFASGVPNYDRFNVGLRPYHGAAEEFLPWPVKGVRGAHDGAHGRTRMMWCFLATFNKTSVITSTDVASNHGFVAQGGYHRYLDHKMLTINIPEKTLVRRIARGVIAAIRRRAHMVRGHWRDDWHLPRGNKALWIPEHQRGDASLGFVTHDYAVEHKP